VSAQNDAAFLRMFLVILGALVAFTIGILVIAHSVSAELRANHPDAARALAQTEAHIAPVAQVSIAGQAPSAPQVVVQTGAEARGGAADLTDDDIRAAVNDMLANSGLPQ